MPEWIAYALITGLLLTGTARVLAVYARRTRPLDSSLWTVCTNQGCTQYEFETEHHITTAGLRCATCQHITGRP
ncbi:hypothetical protein [Streptomyces halstedii]|uniref:hypothetical protein n=1 Tax=Streptomyces halstedii TaxID=1944 RepID=UPI0037FB78AA